MATFLVPPASADADPIRFTAEERAHIARIQVVRMCVDPDWMPFEHVNAAGEHEGIAADLIQLVARRIGLRIELLPTRTWEESLAASKAGRCEIMSFLNQTPAREAWLGFTAPIFLDPNVVITREEHPHIGDLRGIEGESVALPRGTMVEEHIRGRYPGLKVVLTDSERESMDMVDTRKATMTIRSLIVAAHEIKKEGYFNLKIAGQVPDMVNMLRIGVIRGDPLLRDILDKGVATLTPREREEVSNRHVAIRIQRGVDYDLVWRIAAVAAAILLLAVCWNRKLSSLNRELRRLSVTDKLTGLCNRLKTDEILEAETLRAQRFGQTFGLIMIDIDHFKRINDVHGHQAGDGVLAGFADLLRAGTRRTDTAGRWGGEEFMVLCPQTDENGTRFLAETLRRKVAEHGFPEVGPVTASFGVTAFRTGDQPEDMVARADAALYDAKRQGRDRVAVFAGDNRRPTPSTG